MRRAIHAGWIAGLFGLLWLAGARAGVPDEAELLAAPQRIPRLLQRGILSPTAIPNPHWREDACGACHRDAPAPGRLRLRHRDPEALCRYCHTDESRHVHLHPATVTVSRRLLAGMTASFRERLAGSSRRPRLTCLVCHDVRVACRKSNFDERALRHAFLRDGPYRSRTGLCYRCHDPGHYRRLNAHAQVDEQGRVKPDSCLLCHRKVPRELPDGRVLDAELVLDKEPARLCLNCHEVVPHPGGDLPFFTKGGPNHLVKPPPAIARYMRRMAARNGLILPLAPDSGKIYCATCHNPHARGVIRNPRAASGADARRRLRGPSMCENCHDL